MTLPGEGRDRMFTVAIKWVSRIAMHSLRLALDGRMCGIPFQTVQALDVVMRHLPSLRYDYLQVLVFIYIILGC